MRKLSLSLAAACALSASAAQPNDTLNSRLYRLFTPLTFYHNVSGNMLSMNQAANAADESVDNALMSVYLNRPDLVKATETQLQESGTLREDIDKPIEQKVELSEIAAPLPDEPEEVPASEVEVTKPKFWTKKGDGFFQVMQNYVSDNWFKGGESSYSLLGSLTLEANYDNKG